MFDLCRSVHRRAFETLRGAVALCAAATLCGCGVYLHNASLETQTTAIQTDMKALSAPAYLAAQQQHLQDVATREDLALAQYLVASRDVSLLNIVRPTAAGADRRSSPQRLAAAIGFELQLSASTDTLTPRQVAALETAPYRQATLERATPFYNQQLAILKKTYQSRGGTGATDCKTVTAGDVAADPAPARAIYAALRKVCASAETRAAAQPDCAVNLPDGDLKQVCAQITAAAQNPLSEERAAQMAKLAALQKRLPRAAASPTAAAQEALTRFTDALAKVAQAPTNETYTSVLTALDGLLGTDLIKALQSLADKAGSAKVKQATDWTKAVLVAIDAVDAVSAKQATPLDQSSAILIGMAKVRHDLNLVNIEIDEHAQTLALLRQQAAALRAQLHFLARAQKALCADAAPCQPSPDQQRMAEALAYYINASNQGRIPFEVLRFRELQLRRATIVRQAQVIEADYRALIQPAVDQMAAYGAGGVKPDTVAGFLSSLPVAGAIIGK